MPSGKRMRNTEGAVPSEADSDRLSALPDDCLHHVLSFLPAQEAVQTCVLARRWRHLWKFATGLRLRYDDEGLTSVKDFQIFVDQLLFLRGSAPLETFELRFCGFDNKCDKFRLNLWIRHVVMCHLRSLRLEDSNLLDVFDLDDLPLIAPHLTRLELVGIDLNDSLLNFSSCPSLEHIEIAWSSLWDVKEMSSQSLRHMSIKSCFFKTNTIFNLPSLVSLYLDIHLSVVPVLESMPSLQEAFIRDVGSCGGRNYDACSGNAHDNMCLLLKGLSKAKKLALLFESEAFLFRCDPKQFPVFSNLKTLLLNDNWCVAPDFHALTCILKHSPVLEKLTIQLFSTGPEHNVEIIGRYNPLDSSTTISKHLKAIEIKCKVVDETVHNVLNFLGTFNICFTC